MINKIKIGIAGYGAFGSKLIDWLEMYTKDIEIIYIVEPNRHKRDLIKKRGYLAYENIYDLNSKLTNNTELILDCSPRGIGRLNKIEYEKLGISAIFQNGEERLPTDIIYYPGITILSKLPVYIKIPLCSGIAALKILSRLKEWGIEMPNHLFGYHFKVSNTARNLTLNYKQSNQEIKKLFNVDSTMNVIYLRGEPYNGAFVYHGSLSLKFATHIDINKIKQILVVNTDLLMHRKQDIDTFSEPITDKTIIIEDGISYNDNIINIPTISYTPEVNFPINLYAIRQISDLGRKNRK